MRNRTPNAKAAVTGTASRNPSRFAGRNDPTVAPLGEPTAFLDDAQRKAWDCFKAEIPWLVASDRSLVEIACILRARFQQGGEAGINVLQTYSAVLSKLGATPVDRSRTIMRDDEPEPDEFFGNA